MLEPGALRFGVAGWLVPIVSLLGLRLSDERGMLPAQVIRRLRISRPYPAVIHRQPECMHAVLQA